MKHFVVQKLNKSSCETIVKTLDSAIAILMMLDEPAYVLRSKWHKKDCEYKYKAIVRNYYEQNNVIVFPRGCKKNQTYN